MLRRLTLIVAAALGLAVPTLLGALPQSALADSCNKIYVAGGDDVPAGNDISTSQAYPTHLLNDHLIPSPGTWCLYGTPSNGLTSSDYINNGQLALAWNMQPDLITLSVGEQNSSIEDIIDSCFSDVQSQDFAGAGACAGEILGSDPWDGLSKDLTTILSAYKTIMAGNPDLVVAVVGYPDPYPSVDSAEENVVELCTPLVDTELTCETRWQQLPPALEVIHQVFQKLNSTIANEVQYFASGYQGRFVFVDPTSQFSSHCMTMDESIQTQVSHGSDIEEEDSMQSFGCDDSWWSTHGSGNFDPPTYLEPAESGVLVGEEQELTGMGVFPNESGQECISDLIWEAVKIKLGVPQTPADQVCDETNSTTSNPSIDPTGTGTGEAAAGGASGAEAPRGAAGLVAGAAPIALKPRRSKRAHKAACTKKTARRSSARGRHPRLARCVAKARHKSKSRSRRR